MTSNIVYIHIDRQIVTQNSRFKTLLFNLKTNLRGYLEISGVNRYLRQELLDDAINKMGGVVCFRTQRAQKVMLNLNLQCCWSVGLLDCRLIGLSV